MSLFCFGLGYSGARFARRAQGAGYSVVGTSSREVEGLSVLRFEAEEAVCDALRGTTQLVSTVPPDRDGDDAVLARYGGRIKALRVVGWLCYCSSLSVYGDHGGAWIDEGAQPALPLSERGERRLQAEQRWRAFAESYGAGFCCLRIAGIYGEGRNALERLREGDTKPVVRSEGVFNRIHVEDLVQAMFCAMERRAVGIFNICDDEPAPSHEPMLYAARLLGLSEPALVSVEEARKSGLLSDMAWSFHRENKRASNRRMKEVLGVTLKYPDYRKGLESLLPLK